MNHKKLRPALPRGEAAGAPARRPQAGAGHAGAAWRCRTAPTSAGPWISCPTPSPTAGASASWRRRRLHARDAWRWSPTPRCRALRVARELDALIRRARPARDVRLRQRHGADQHGDPELVPADRRRLALHRARQAAAERLRRELQRALRDECLNETLFSSLSQARSAITSWKEDYNHHRPHSALANMSPAEFAMKSTLEKQAA